MSKSSKTIVYFSYYVFLVGIQLTFIPNFFLKTIQQPESSEPWIRIVGIVAIVLAYYYYQMGRNGIVEFSKATVFGRTFFFVAMAALVVFKLAPVIFIGLGVIDFLGAIWTWQALRSEGKM